MGFKRGLMVKKEVNSRVFVSFLFILLIVVFSSYIILASHDVSPTSFNVNEDVSNLYNITINNTDPGQDANITQVNITFLSNTFLFIVNTNGTNTPFISFTNTSTVLSWTNSTGYLINGSTNNSYFWFNATASTPGLYNISVMTLNATGAFVTNISITVNDTTAPDTIQFVSPTPASGANLSLNYLEVNVTATDNGVIGTILARIYNSSNSLINSSSSSTSPLYVNFSGLSDGIYYINATVNDSAGNSNSTETRTITLDTVAPNGTVILPQNGSYTNITQQNFTINVSDVVGGSGVINATLNIYNQSGLYNRTTITNPGTGVVGVVVGLIDGVYTWFWELFDFAGNYFNTQSVGGNGTITEDTTYASVVFGIGTQNNGANVSVNWVYANVSVIEINEANITFSLSNTTSIVNSTVLAAGTRTINWTGLSDDTYYYNVTVTDLVNNRNSSETRTIRVDTTNPQFVGPATLINQDDFFSTFDKIVNISINVTDATALIVQANLSNISTTLNCGNGANAILNLTLTNNLYQGQCDISSEITSVTIPQPKVITFTALDSAQNVNATASPLNIIVHNLDVPASASSPGPCNATRFGPSTTNFTQVLNFSNINFIMDIEGNFTCISGGQVQMSNWRDVTLINITSVDISTQQKAQKLQALGQNMLVNISAPKQFGISRIYINSTYFAELNTTTTIVFYSLPFTSMPNITADPGAAGVVGGQTTWASNGYDANFMVATGNLTFVVNGFSGYDITDNSKPLITINTPAGNINTSLIINVTVNGTGTEPSLINITLSPGQSYFYDGGVNTSNCAPISNGSDTFNCVISVITNDTSYTLNVTAIDYGGTAGNTNSSFISFIKDTVYPVITLTSPANNSYVNSTTVTFNFNATDANQGALDCNLFLDRPADTINFNISSINMSTVVNISQIAGISNGAHNWTVECFDLGMFNYNYTQTNFFTVDTIVPLISFGTGTAADNANLSQNWIYVNVSVTEANENTTVFKLYNTTGLVNSTSSTAGLRTINWTGLSDGTYTYNVTVNDSAGNTNTTATRTANLDAGAPQIVFGTGTAANNANVSQTNVYVNVSLTEPNLANITFRLYNDTATVNTTMFTTAVLNINWTNLSQGNYSYEANATDNSNNKNSTGKRYIYLDTTAPSISSFSCSPDSVSKDATVTCSCTGSDSGSGVSTTSFNVNPSTSSTGTFTETCTITDYAGNSVSTTTTYSVTSSSSGGSAPSGSSGTTWSNTYLYDNFDLEEMAPLTRMFKEQERARVSIGGEKHYIGILEINPDNVKIIVSSTPQEATLNVGDTRKFDVSDDNFYDIQVTLNGISNNLADLAISSIHEEITPETVALEEEKEEIAAGEEAKPEEAEKTKRGWQVWIFVAVIVLIIIVFAIKFLKKGKRRK
ncbi:MAG TPA: hypothetical protein VJH65_02630 [Candidatus Nanoarchaeia archaeon]|nr:hypothetical protein [Candidatus Nanoarchaeia archaeon]